MQFNIDLLPFMKCYEFMWWMHGWQTNKEKNWWHRETSIDHAVMAAPPQTYITRHFLDFIDRLHVDTPENKQIRDLCKSNAEDSRMNVTLALSQLTLTGSHYFMAIIDSLSTGDEKMLFINSGLLITGHRLGSWGFSAKGTLGNKSVRESTLDIFDVTPHRMQLAGTNDTGGPVDENDLVAENTLIDDQTLSIDAIAVDELSKESLESPASSERIIDNMTMSQRIVGSLNSLFFQFSFPRMIKA
jgi:hypothetical protein